MHIFRQIFISLAFGQKKMSLKSDGLELGFSILWLQKHNTIDNSQNASRRFKNQMMSTDVN